MCIYAAAAEATGIEPQRNVWEKMKGIRRRRKTTCVSHTSVASRATAWLSCLLPTHTHHTFSLEEALFFANSYRLNEAKTDNLLLLG